MAGTITHKWYGTTLAITSDSGTSMCDLKGTKGDMGIRGPQGCPGVIRKEDGTIDMTAYCTETYVDEKIANIEVEADFSDYFTQSETVALLQDGLNGYATETYVNEAIGDVVATFGNYYTKTETDTTIKDKLTGYATEEYVEARINAIDVGTDIDLSDYYTKEETDTAIQDALDGASVDVDLTGYATEEYVSSSIAKAQLSGGEVNMDAYYTKSEVDAVITASGGIGRAGTGSKAEIFNDYSGNTASGNYSHAEGSGTFAIGRFSHAEGITTVAKGDYSHTEGYNSRAEGTAAHAEGYTTKAIGDYSHAEGYSTNATGRYSHAEGQGTVANRPYQHVQGMYNIIDTEGSAYTKGRYAHIVGNGENANNLSNAFTLDWEGNAWFAGNVYVGGTSMDDATQLGSGGGGSGDMSNYYTKAEIDELLGVIENGTY